jgi:hypothetical protein
MLLPLELVLNIMTCSLPADSDASLNAAHPTTKLLLGFTLVCRRTRRLANRYLRQHCICLDSKERLGKFLGATSTQPELCNVTSMVLSPFGETLNDDLLCSRIAELFDRTGKTVTKLLINMSLYDHIFGGNEPAIPVLRKGFEKLVNLEQFVSTADDVSFN